MATTPKPGDWIGLAMSRNVPGVTRETPRKEAMARLLDHLVEGLFAQYGPPPGMTADELGLPDKPPHYRLQQATGDRT